MGTKLVGDHLSRGTKFFGDHLSRGTNFDGDHLSRGTKLVGDHLSIGTKFFGTICPWGPNWLGTVCPEGPINWGPIVRDQMSRDHMRLGPNVSQPENLPCKIYPDFFQACHTYSYKSEKNQASTLKKSG